MLTKSAITFKILAAIIAVLAINVLSSFLFARLDFTGDKRYTLSQATKDILADLDSSVTVTAYFSDNLPAQIQYVRNEFEDLLVEYSSRSGGKIDYHFEDPSSSPEKEQAAMQQGVRPLVVQARERDQFKEQRAYMGAVLQHNGQTEVIAAIQPGAAMEYALSSAVKKIAATDKPRIGFVQGHGEASPQAMPEVLQAMSVMYQPQPVQLSDSALLSFKTLVIVAPTDTFMPQDLARLDAFLAAGKGVFVALNRVQADLQGGGGTSLNTGLEAWLAQKGVTANDNFVIDAKCAPITLQQQNGFFTFNQQVAFPYLVLANNFADHPAVKGIEQVIFPFISSLNSSNKSGVTFTPLVISSQTAGTETPPVAFDAQKPLQSYNFVTSNLVLGGALEGSLADGGSPAKMVVYGDGDFAVNGEGQRAQRLAPDNINLFTNGIDWLSDDTGLSELRTKVVTSRPIKRELSDSSKQLVKFGNFLLPLLLILGYGFVRLQSRRQKKLRWASERYV